MPRDMLLALTAYAFVTSVTPGPNNVMLLASGRGGLLKRFLTRIGADDTDGEVKMI